MLLVGTHASMAKNDKMQPVDKKYTLCHFTKEFGDSVGGASFGQLITVSRSALPAHLKKHGDADLEPYRTLDKDQVAEIEKHFEWKLGNVKCYSAWGKLERAIHILGRKKS